MSKSNAAVLRVFISHDTSDIEYKDRLRSQLRVLSRSCHVEDWSDDQILPGMEQDECIKQAIESSDIAILLVSAAYLANSVIQEVYLPALLARHYMSKLTIIPLLVRSCAWEHDLVLSKLKMIPPEGKAVASLPGDQQDRALADVVRLIASHATARQTTVPQITRPPVQREIPLRLLVLGDFWESAGALPLAKRPIADLRNGQDLESLLATCRAGVQLKVKNLLGVLGPSGDDLELNLTIGELSEFTPESMVRQVPSLSEVSKRRRALDMVYRVGDRCVQEKIVSACNTMDRGGMVVASEMASLDPDVRGQVALAVETLRLLLPQQSTSFEQILAAATLHIDGIMGQQLDAIIHAPKFQCLEAAWRSLFFLVEHAEFPKDTTISVLNVTKSELGEDLRQAGVFTQTILHQTLQKAIMAEPGHSPFGLILCNFEFCADDEDRELLSCLADTAAAAHAPLLAGAQPELLGLKSFTQLGEVRQNRISLGGCNGARWQTLCRNDSSRYIGLCVPRILLRRRYEESRSGYHETITGPMDQLWGNAAFALATRCLASFSRHRFLHEVTGSQMGGRVNLVRDHEHGPTDAVIPDSLGALLAREGLTALAQYTNGDYAVFWSVPSLYRPQEIDPDPDCWEQRDHVSIAMSLLLAQVIHSLRAHYYRLIACGEPPANLERALNEQLRRWIGVGDDSIAFRATYPLSGGQLRLTADPLRTGRHEMLLEIIKPKDHLLDVHQVTERVAL